MDTNKKFKNFIDKDKLYALINRNAPTQQELDTILERALKLKGLDLEDVATLLRVTDHEQIYQIMNVAKIVKMKSTANDWYFLPFIPA